MDLVILLLQVSVFASGFAILCVIVSSWFRVRSGPERPALPEDRRARVAPAHLFGGALDGTDVKVHLDSQGRCPVAVQVPDTAGGAWCYEFAGFDSEGDAIYK